MTDAEIREQFADQKKQINKLKSHNTRLSKALVEAGVKVPVPNWKDEAETETENSEKS
ncbi:MAG: hypothetical protein R3279_12585 [Putridiphycobacter sp.]|nr:hypothetical protein [Putridiphycobacter sp.]